MAPYIEEFFDSGEELHDQYGFTYSKDAWYQRGKDFMLITKQSGKISVMIWNDVDPRSFWRGVARFETYLVSTKDIIETDPSWMPPLSAEDQTIFDKK